MCRWRPKLGLFGASNSRSAHELASLNFNVFELHLLIVGLYFAMFLQIDICIRDNELSGNPKLCKYIRTRSTFEWLRLLCTESLTRCGHKSIAVLTRNVERVFGPL